MSSLGVRSRRSIHESNSPFRTPQEFVREMLPDNTFNKGVSQRSPRSPRKQNEQDSAENHSAEEDPGSDEEDVSEEEQNHHKFAVPSESVRPSAAASTKPPNITIIGIISVIVISIVSVIAVQFNSSAPNSTSNEITLESVRIKYPQQSEDLWNAVEAGIADVAYFNKPVVFVLLHESKSTRRLKMFLRDTAEHIYCKLNNCEMKEPVYLDSEILNKTEYILDYGNLIDDYQQLIEDRIVMVVEDLQDVPGATARAFHSICDEVTPLVPKSVIFFTMKVNRLPEKSMKYVEDYFKIKWRDIKVDEYNALITRITSMVLNFI